MAIPTVSKADVEWALRRIDEKGIPKNRRSKKWCLLCGEQHYPPKYVLSLAVEHLTGTALPPREHSGGDETNSVLRQLGYEIVLSPAGSNTKEV